MKKIIAISLFALLGLTMSVSAKNYCDKETLIVTGSEYAVSKTINVDTVSLSFVTNEVAYAKEAKFYGVATIFTENTASADVHRTIPGSWRHGDEKIYNYHKDYKPAKIYLLNCSIKQCTRTSLNRSV